MTTIAKARAKMRQVREDRERREAIKATNTPEAQELWKQELEDHKRDIQEHKLIIEELTATYTRLKKENPGDVETLQQITDKVNEHRQAIAELEIRMAEERARLRMPVQKR